MLKVLQCVLFSALYLFYGAQEAFGQGGGMDPSPQPASPAPQAPSYRVLARLQKASKVTVDTGLQKDVDYDIDEVAIAVPKEPTDAEQNKLFWWTMGKSFGQQRRKTGPSSKSRQSYESVQHYKTAPYFKSGSFYKGGPWYKSGLSYKNGPADKTYKSRVTYKTGSPYKTKDFYKNEPSYKGKQLYKNGQYNQAKFNTKGYLVCEHSAPSCRSGKRLQRFYCSTKDGGQVPCKCMCPNEVDRLSKPTYHSQQYI